ncbi:hypothetical protein DYQ86_08650 [Acidobacteria bacterium AB60]|nr:hypothetical protein DYQ86_08650 [Acidobacteria bacterium AB60]
MYYPTVGERVWVEDCPNAFLVIQVDYTACLATLAPITDGEGLRENVPFQTLVDSRKPNLKEDLDRNAIQHVLYSSQHRVQTAQRQIADLRETIYETMEMIRQSGSLLATSDQLIERVTPLNDGRLPRQPALPKSDD